MPEATTDRPALFEAYEDARADDLAGRREASRLPSRIERALRELTGLLHDLRSLADRAARARARLEILHRLAGVDSPMPPEINLPDVDAIVGTVEGRIRRAMSGNPAPQHRRDLRVLEAILIATDPAPARDIEALDRGRVGLIEEAVRTATEPSGRTPLGAEVAALVEAARARAAELAARTEG
jgi:hypothetical protein